jgi:ATP-dependent HslUV protease ATP-binding subunit HslU
VRIKQLTAEASWSCPEIVARLDRYIVGQNEAKRAVAIALRNRWRRMRLPEEIRREVVPNNIILIGPTGVGKTEIARRLSQIADLPLVKVEATKFTEKGYVGRDVDAMVRDIVENAVALVRRRAEEAIAAEIDGMVEERLVDLLFPPLAGTEDPQRQERWQRSREKIREQLRQSVLDEREVTIQTESQQLPIANIFTSAGEEIDASFGESLKSILPKRRKQRTVSVAEARRILREQESERRLDMDQIVQEAISLTEQGGIIFLDEIDKIAGGFKGAAGHGPDVSREGVQRDLLPIVEGSTVTTKYGPIRTDHILFIAAGAFHMSKPSDLIPELQGRFPIRVELENLTEADFVRILRETDSSLLRQYEALLGVDGCQLEFTDGAVDEIARLAAELNRRLENIGARRLQTILAQLLDDLLFAAPVESTGAVKIDRAHVRAKVGHIVADDDLSRYIL